MKGDTMILDQIQELIEQIPTSNEKICFAMGYDAAINGADEKNCHFSLFSSKENTAAWEAGNRKGFQKCEATKKAKKKNRSAARGTGNAWRMPCTRLMK